MNTFMWHQRVTGQHLEALRARGVSVVPPVAKKLACGDVGVGAMAEVSDIVEAALGLAQSHKQAEVDALAAGKPRFQP